MNSIRNTQMISVFDAIINEQTFMLYTNNKLLLNEYYIKHKNIRVNNE